MYTTLITTTISAANVCTHRASAIRPPSFRASIASAARFSGRFATVPTSRTRAPIQADPRPRPRAKLESVRAIGAGASENAAPAAPAFAIAGVSRCAVLLLSPRRAAFRRAVHRHSPTASGVRRAQRTTVSGNAARLTCDSLRQHRRETLGTPHPFVCTQHPRARARAPARCAPANFIRTRRERQVTVRKRTTTFPGMFLGAPARTTCPWWTRKISSPRSREWPTKDQTGALGCGFPAECPAAGSRRREMKSDPAERVEVCSGSRGGRNEPWRTGVLVNRCSTYGGH